MSEWLIVHMTLPVGFRRQGLHKLFQAGAVFRRQLGFERMSQGAFHAAHPAVMFIVQVGSPSSHFASRIHPHPISCADDPHHLSLGQDFAASHASPLRHMLHTLNRFLRHLQIIRRTLLPIAFRFAALVDLASHNFAQVFIEFQFDGLLLALLAFLLFTVDFLFSPLGILEDFGLHLE
ncbi:hypothetical protein ANAEL_01338 [Anaerolineales bacterium]|nr:hypothetical protein ANAEL_01338 [Anaerolineales bacterium]